jgi:pyrroloquinoline quinone biosynthesis protein B
VAGILVTNADLDHTLGLFILREGGRLVVHATAKVRRTLSEHLHLDIVLSAYCGIEWREPPGDLAPLLGAAGAPTGLRYSSFAVPGKPPRYASAGDVSPGDAVGYRFVDEKTGDRLVVIPDTAGIDDLVAAQMRDCDVLFFDGTFFDEDEMRRAGVGTALASEMGHIPIGGPGGSLRHLAALPEVRRIYVHINNTNPILLENSPQRGAVETAGIIVGYDGMDVHL